MNGLVASLCGIGIAFLLGLTQGHGTEGGLAGLWIVLGFGALWAVGQLWRQIKSSK